MTASNTFEITLVVFAITIVIIVIVVARSTPVPDIAAVAAVGNAARITTFIVYIWIAILYHYLLNIMQTIYQVYTTDKVE